MNLIIGGDVVPKSQVGELFENGDIEGIFGTKLNKVIQESNYIIFNLESPLTNSEIKIKKTGPHLKASPKVIKGIKKINPLCVMLANNHIMDYSVNGIKDTIKLLDKNHINWIGVGKNKDNLKKSFVFTAEDNKKIAIYNCCEREFSIAESDKYGANDFDIYNIDEDLKNLKQDCDYLIVIYHGGKELYRYPSPELQKRCRKMVDFGANLIVCQHSHCIGCFEDYKNGKIIYGQGNFLFTSIQNEYWNTSLLINLDLKDYSINYIPIIQHPNGTRLAEGDDKKNILEGFMHRSKEIKNEKFIVENYDKLAEEKLNSYLISSSPFKIIYKIIRKLFPWLYKRIKYNYAVILNSIECEAHQELYIKGLKNKLKEDSNEK